MGICCVAQGAPTEARYQPRGVGWGDRWKGVQNRVDICIPMADSC